MIDPFVPPGVVTFDEVVFAAKTGGCVTVTVCVALQLFASVAVKVYIRAVNPLNVPPVCVPVIGEIRYVIAPVPPVAETITLPLFPALQDTLVIVALPKTRAVGWVTVAFAEAVQPKASVTVTV